MYTFTVCPHCLGCKYYRRGSIVHYFLFSQQPASHISYRWEMLKLWNVEQSGPSLWAEGIRARSTRLHASAGLRGGSHCLGYLLPGFLPDLLCDSDEVICSLPAFWNLLCSGPGAPITLYPCSVVTRHASASFTISQSLIKLMSIELMMPSNYLILYHLLLLLPSIFPSINKSALRISWPKYWSYSVNPSSEYSGLISFKIGWFDLVV